MTAPDQLAPPTLLVPLALLTQHGKQTAVQVALQQAGYAVTTVHGFDTDTLGTFTGETARKGSQLDAATTKARLATELSGQRFGLGSEGSFGPDPYVGLTAWAQEVLVWWDAFEQRAIFALTQGPQTNYAQRTVRSWAQAQEFATDVGFPSHGVVVSKPGTPAFFKEAPEWVDLEQYVLTGLTHGPLWLETDMRAHRNPTRLAMISQCSQELARLLQCACPSCQRKGFGEDFPIRGALCSSCGFATTAIRAKTTRCNACGYSEDTVVQATVPSSRCERCNP